MQIPRIVLGGASSTVGKTIIACGIVHGLRKRGFSVQPFKVGPDYIDPTYLGAVSENPAHNLDAWLMGPAGVASEFVRHSKSDVSVIEGVMGYYDGLNGTTNRASTHHIATILSAKTILVLDASKTARSIAATALGFARFHSNSRIAGIIINRVASRRHEALCSEALANLRIPVVGMIPRDAEMQLESRHLGLVPATGSAQRHRIQKIAGRTAGFLDMDRIVSIAHSAGSLQPHPAPRPRPPRCVIAVALDDSFNFYYPANLEVLRRSGATLKFFSPISDRHLPRCDGIYLGGGFPEVMSEMLGKNATMRQDIKNRAQAMTPIYAECGGLMYLTKFIRTGRKKHPMVGFLDSQTAMTKKMTLAYTNAGIISDSIISDKNAPGTRSIHGHEFHYSALSFVPHDTRFAYKLRTGTGIVDMKDGIIQENTLASYCHLFFGTHDFAKNMVRACIMSARR